MDISRHHEKALISRRKAGATGRLKATASKAANKQSLRALRPRRKFLRIFPRGFYDDDYVSLEREYKWNAHKQWDAQLGVDEFRYLLKNREFKEIAARAVRIESRTNLLFSFEKMALRDAVRKSPDSQLFAEALFELLHGRKTVSARFKNWVSAIDRLPRRQTRVLTWPLATVFGFIARPAEHFFFKPTVTREAARRYGVDLPYAPRPSAELYASLLKFVHQVKRDIRDLRPRDMIDMQSYLWIQGSEEYSD